MKKPHVAIIVQARMGSTRLPGKILKTVLGKPLLSYLIERLRRVTLADQLIIATTTKSEDDAIITLCQKEGIDTFRGSEGDVLNRYYLSAYENKADVVVRVTSDCPLVDPAIIDQVISNLDGLDYVSNTAERTYPRGMDVEVFTFNALAEANAQAKDSAEREHVTPYILHHPERFQIGSTKSSTNNSHYRLTVDTPEDLELIRRILEALYPNNPLFTVEDLLQLLKENPEWPKINANVKQKAI